MRGELVEAATLAAGAATGVTAGANSAALHRQSRPGGGSDAGVADIRPAGVIAEHDADLAAREVARSLRSRVDRGDDQHDGAEMEDRRKHTRRDPALASRRGRMAKSRTSRRVGLSSGR